jgi:hypothetical protein
MIESIKKAIPQPYLRQKISLVTSIKLNQSCDIEQDLSTNIRDNICSHLFWELKREDSNFLHNVNIY